MGKVRDTLLAAKLKRNGIKYPLTTIQEARRAKIAVSLACALLEQESGGGHNVFGHDPTIFKGAGTVTKEKYLTYKKLRGHTRMQGVGPVQLTWWEFQDKADHYGGCWLPRFNMRVGFEHLSAAILAKGERAGIKAYNGAGPAADTYAVSVLRKKARWHQLIGKI